MPSESGSGWSPPASTSERRLSNSSDGSACSGYSKATSDSADFLATRPHTAAVLPGKPAGNPLQFIKVGPAELGSRAREQLRKAELAKRADPARIERQEDWQSNLDNWKSSRRKRVEHIIERCVEVRRMEAEPQPRAKAKTFNEMLEERAGRRKKNHLALYLDEDSHDLSDLGIGTSSTKSSLSEDCDTHSLASDGMDLDKNHSDVDNISNCDTSRKLCSSANEYDTCTTTTISSPEPEEYTYEGAIEGYKSRIISQTNSSILKTVVNNNSKEKCPDKINIDLNRIRTTVSNKLEEKVSSFQQDRNNDIKNNNPKKDLPKINIHKRREQFERENSQEPQTNKPKLPELANKTSIKERLSHLEKFNEEKTVQKSNVDLTKLPAEVKPLKERLSSLEKVKSGTIDINNVKKLSNGDFSNTKSVKERLSSLKSQTSEEEVKTPKTEIKEMSMSFKERLSCLDAAKHKEVPKILVEEDLSHAVEIDSKIRAEDKDPFSDSSLKSSFTGIENQMQSFCRSLDSLDINGQSSPSFDRIQSLEDFECAELQNNTVPSDIETEDSGIHTARDSCAPPDDIADLTQVASPLGEPMVEVLEYESSNEENLIALEPVKIEEPPEQPALPITTILEDVIIEELEDLDTKTENTDSASNYLQAVSQFDESSVTEEVTEIQLDKDDEDTLKSLDNQDTSVSVNEASNASDEAVVFEGKMTIHLDLNELCNARSGAGNNNCTESSSSDTNRNCMPMVIDALELAFQELDSEDSVNQSTMDAQDAMDKTIDNVKTSEIVKVDSAKESAGNKAPLYENVEMFSPAVDGDVFPLDLPATALEPPKEKPPPPPVEDNTVDDELLGNGNFKHTNSARRIKKEIRNKRTSFLGIDPQDDDYLDVDLVAPRPDITSFLQEETKIEKLLYKKSLSHDMDAKLRDSRDSGVDFDRGPVETWYKGQSSADHSTSHSRQNSEPFTHNTVTSDEEEATKRQNDRLTTHLTSKLCELAGPPRRAEPPHLAEDKLDTLEKKIEQSQGRRFQSLQSLQSMGEDCLDGAIDDVHTKEVLRFERELLQLEQEELRRQRENLLRDQTRIIQKSTLDVSQLPSPHEKPINAREKDQNHRHSMPNLFVNETLTAAPSAVDNVAKVVDENKRKPFVSEEHIQRHFGVEESRRVLYNERKSQEAVRKPVASVVRPPQPILPPKPRSRDSLEREITMRSSRIPSALDAEPAARHRTTPPAASVPAVNSNAASYQSMTRHTLQALSAAPTPKLMSNSEWLQAKTRRPADYDYSQHWVVQEAEQRRLDSQLQQRCAQRHSLYVTSSHAPVTSRQLVGREGLLQSKAFSHSHHLLPQDYKHPSSTSIREQPIRPQISPRPDMPLRPEVTKRTELMRPEVTKRSDLMRPDAAVRPEAARRSDVQRTDPPAPPVRMESNDMKRSELRPDVTRTEVMRDREKSEGREEKMLSVSGRRKCSHCGEELGRGSAMIISSLSLVYHVWCFRCGVCGAPLGDGRAGADVRLRGGRLHCPHCYSSDDGRKYSQV